MPLKFHESNAGLSGGLLGKGCIVADDMTLDALSLDDMSRYDSVRSDTESQFSHMCQQWIMFVMFA